MANYGPNARSCCIRTHVQQILTNCHTCCYANQVSMEDFLKSVADEATAGGGMLVDCTATEATIPALLAAAASGRAVCANKKPFSSSHATQVTPSGPTLSTVAQPRATQRPNAPGLGLA